MRTETPQPVAGQPGKQQTTSVSGHGWLRRELILAGILIAVGALLLPVAIYFIGQALLGPYSDEGYGLGRLYGDIFGDLAAGFAPAWILVLSPWLGIQVLRLSLLPLSRKREPGPR